ncbi:hypothetical protein HGRIS_008757 [Hohenbuehelia grisea]|uniref:Fungal-type protein kinase domain-containing protein n=1 Tax=Hohenbuehelia grisea TaxID=104357 RepID=A0ABR3J965_9AGAR
MYDRTSSLIPIHLTHPMSSPSASLKRRDDDEPSEKPNNLDAVFVDATYRYSSSSTSRTWFSEGLPAKCPHEGLLCILPSGLGSAVQESKHTCEAFCLDPDYRAFSSLDDPRTKGALISSTSGVTIKGWFQGDAERSSHKRFVNLLNQIDQALKECYPTAKSYHVDEHIKSFPYDKPMVETIHDSEVLKSQLIGASKEQCSWFVAEILGEVGSKRKRLIVLVGSYAKSVFATADIQREPQGTMSTGLPTSLQRHRRPLQRLLRLQSARPTGTIELPDLLVTECSLLVAGKDLEEDIFRLVTPYVGIADNITMHDIPCVQTLDEVAHWRILDVTKKVRHVSQLRLDRHLPVRTVGRSLRTAHGPRELGFAILHAMIGHCALFTVAGYVHREVTIGNILLLDEADELEIPPCLVNIIESTDCIAVLLDGGFVKKWGDTRDVTRHRSVCSVLHCPSLFSNRRIA